MTTSTPQECPTPGGTVPRYVAQDPDQTLRFYFVDEQGRDAYASAPDPGVAILDVGGPAGVPDWATEAPHWVRALTAPITPTEDRPEAGR